MSWSNYSRNESDVKLAESLSGSASGSLFSRIVGGVIVPLAIAGYGLYACIAQKATFPGRRGLSLELSDNIAISFGIGVIGLALFFHFHFIWTVSKRFLGVADFAKIIAMLIFIGGLGYVMWHIIMIGV